MFDVVVFLTSFHPVVILHVGPAASVNALSSQFGFISTCSLIAVRYVCCVMLCGISRHGALYISYDTFSDVSIT